MHLQMMKMSPFSPGSLKPLTEAWRWYDDVFEDIKLVNAVDRLLIVLVKLVKWGGFEDILTSFYSSRVWVYTLRIPCGAASDLLNRP